MIQQKTGRRVKVHWTLIGFAVLVVMSSNARAGEFHKWVDDAGVVHYGEAAPDHQTSTTVETEDEPSDSEHEVTTPEQQLENQNRVIQQLSEERERRQSEKEAAASKKQKHDGECKKLRGRMSTLKNGGRIFWTQPDGEREYMSDAMRAQKIKETEALLKKHCA